jgi:hypothetical protein
MKRWIIKKRVRERHNVKMKLRAVKVKQLDSDLLEQV